MPFVCANHIRFHYESQGDGPALLFLHGIGSSTADWAEQIREFSKNYRALALDLRGHGESDKPPGPYSMALFAADAAAVLRALDIRTAHVVGLSLGGCVAFQMAVDFPELVQSLVVVNSAPEIVRRSFRTLLESWRRTAIVRWRGLRPLGERVSRRLLPKPEHAALRAAFVERFAQNDPQAYLESLKAVVGWSVANRLQSLACPVLVVSADHDYTPVSAKERYVRRLPDARLVVIADARHATPVERPREFDAALAEFLAQVQRRPRPENPENPALDSP